jgi:hypothetical protein
VQASGSTCATAPMLRLREAKKLVNSSQGWLCSAHSTAHQEAGAQAFTGSTQ